jgi:hypothetical protein
MAALLSQHFSHQELPEVFIEGCHFFLPGTERPFFSQKFRGKLAAQLFKLRDKVEEPGASKSKIFNGFVENGYRGTLHHGHVGMNLSPGGENHFFKPDLDEACSNRPELLHPVKRPLVEVSVKSGCTFENEANRNRATFSAAELSLEGLPHGVETFLIGFASAQVDSTNRPAQNVRVAVLDAHHLLFIHRNQGAALEAGFAYVPPLDVSRKNDPGLAGHLFTLVDMTQRPILVAL